MNNYILTSYVVDHCGKREYNTTHSPKTTKWLFQRHAAISAGTAETFVAATPDTIGSAITVIVVHYCHKVRVRHLCLVIWVTVSFLRDGFRLFCDRKILQTNDCRTDLILCESIQLHDLIPGSPVTTANNGRVKSMTSSLVPLKEMIQCT